MTLTYYLHVCAHSLTCSAAQMLMSVLYTTVIFSKGLSYFAMVSKSSGAPLLHESGAHTHDGLTSASEIN